MTARAGTPAGDELDILVTLVAAYEEKHHPLGDPTHRRHPAPDGGALS